jgi:hypothetical protein
MAEATSCWRPTVESGFDDRPVHVNLWWIKWHWNRFPSEYSAFPCQHYATHVPHFFFILLVSGPQAGEAWEPPNKACSFGYRGILNRKILTHCFSLQRVDIGNNQIRSEGIFHHLRRVLAFHIKIFRLPERIQKHSTRT